MSQEIQDVRLVIEILNKEPLELIELTKSLVSLGSQFERFVQKNGENKEDREAKLFVKEIKSGSVILHLIETSTVGILPFLENVNTVIGFAKHCKKIYEFYLNPIKDASSSTALDIDATDIKELSSIINPTALDNGSQFNINATINGNVTVNLSLNSNEANAIQNRFKTEIENLKQPDAVEAEYVKVLFYWHQAKNDLDTDKGNKGVIEEITAKPLSVIFQSEEIKEQMLKGQTNPFTHAYEVDTKIQTIKGKPAVYKITKFHEAIIRDDNE